MGFFLEDDALRRDSVPYSSHSLITASLSSGYSKPRAMLWPTISCSPLMMSRVRASAMPIVTPSSPSISPMRFACAPAYIITVLPPRFQPSMSAARAGVLPMYFAIGRVSKRKRHLGFISPYVRVRAKSMAVYGVSRLCNMCEGWHISSACSGSAVPSWIYDPTLSRCVVKASFALSSTRCGSSINIIAPSGR